MEENVCPKTDTCCNEVCGTCAFDGVVNQMEYACEGEMGPTGFSYCVLGFSDANVFPEYILPQLVSCFPCWSFLVLNAYMSI